MNPAGRCIGLLAVEGPHDVEFCARLLRDIGLDRVRWLKDLDPALSLLVPPNFPHQGDLQMRMPVPLFLQNAEVAIVVHSAMGDDRLAAALQESLTSLQLKQGMKPTDLIGIGCLLDSDTRTQDAAQRFEALRQKFRASTTLSLPIAAGAVSHGAPRLGAFVLPDNKTPGTLEDLLMDSAELQYPQLLGLARDYVDAALSPAVVPRSHLQEVRKPAGRQKAVIGAMTGIFKPGKAAQMSIQDNDWLRGDALKLPRIREVQRFLAELFDLPLPTT